MSKTKEFRVSKEDLQFHRRQLVLAKRNHRKIKAVNKIIRSKPRNRLTEDKRKKLREKGYIEEIIIRFFHPNQFCEFGYYPDEIKASYNKIKRIKSFIEHLEKNGVVK